MFRGKSTDEGSNFWISYADLMAGLLFVFILLIGAIVSKSIILKTDLHKKEDTLAKMSQTLKKKEYSLVSLNEMLSKKQQELKLRADEIKKLNQMLLEANTQKDLLSNKIVIVQNLLKESNETVHQQTKKIEEYEGKVLVLSNELTEANNTVKLKDEKLLELLNALDEKQTKYDELVANLQAQKAKIKALTGIKLKVIAALKEQLGDKINIDKESGSLRLASSILFDKGSSELKEESKANLKKAFEEYIGALVSNSQIKPYLDRIIIEGHTDSDGGYLYNLDLSQKRALAVMNFLLTLDIAKQENLKPLLIASGRAYLDAINVNGVEDKEASRRIEIKFGLKNEDAMHEIEEVLDAQ
ncbi:MAG: OmpA family protein [Campylobacterales bacterium]|nr:OmpA family protein [Campylobacterales bacterium]